MDKEQARFILRSFRPDGADVNDQDFAEALALAMEDRELGEWLARERAFDAAFAQALSAIAIPETLRQDIIGCLHGAADDFSPADDRHDAAWIGALASIEPPPALRQEIIAAMERTARKKPAASLWKRIAMPIAAAAGIALALILTHESSHPSSTIASALPVASVEASFIRFFESPDFSLDLQRDDHRALIAHLKSRQLPTPDVLPPGLANVKGIGCRELIIDGKHGSLVCFDEREIGVVHLVIFRREDIINDLPQRDQPAFSQEGTWASAHWANEQNAFILISQTDTQKLAALF